MKSDSVFEILAEPILSSLKVYGKKVDLILNVKVNHGLDKFGLRVVIHCYKPPRQYNIGLENTEMLLVWLIIVDKIDFSFNTAYACQLYFTGKFCLENLDHGASRVDFV